MADIKGFNLGGQLPGGDKQAAVGQTQDEKDKAAAELAEAAPSTLQGDLRESPEFRADTDEPVVEASQVVKTYTCFPIQTLTVAHKFTFEKGKLELSTPEDVEEFEAALKNLNPIHRSWVKTLDTAMADEIARQFGGAAAIQGGTTAGERNAGLALGAAIRNTPGADKLA